MVHISGMQFFSAT